MVVLACCRNSILGGVGYTGLPCGGDEFYPGKHAGTATSAHKS